MKRWRFVEELTRVQSRWLTLFCERWIDEQDRQLEYWRVEKDDSLIVLPLQAGNILCPAPCFRPGVNQTTLDLPGGRVASKEDLDEAARSILKRELGIREQDILSLTPLNEQSWPVNSSFSNQGLWAYTAELAENAPLPADVQVFAANSNGIEQLLDQTDCLQCRSVIREYQFRL